MAELIERARRYAGDAHRKVGQLRKYSGQPYEEHLRRVAEIVTGVTDDPAAIAAAWLHDVVEDTPTTIEDIEREFGQDVRLLVDALTDISRPHHGNRAARKALDREHLARAPAHAQTVKLADLIDNCQDICRHSPRFGRVFLTEMAALLDALRDGDASLRRRARKTLDTWRGRLARVEAPAAAGAPGTRGNEIEAQVRRTARIFTRAFRAADVAVPLRVFDAAGRVDAALALSGTAIFGVRANERVTGYVPRTDLSTGSFAAAMLPIASTQLVDGNAGLADVVLALTRHDLCFVTAQGDVTAYVGRDQMQSPVARMWLFGMITSFELVMTEGIRSLGDALDWSGFITSARLDKARALQETRAALGRPVPLLDCLQLSDKVRIVLATDDSPRPLLRGASKAESQRLVRDLEDLRNGLAHAQDIVTHDWAQIARLAKRIEELANE